MDLDTRVGYMTLSVMQQWYESKAQKALCLNNKEESLEYITQANLIILLRECHHFENGYLAQRIGGRSTSAPYAHNGDLR